MLSTSRIFSIMTCKIFRTRKFTSIKLSKIFTERPKYSQYSNELSSSSKALSFLDLAKSSLDTAWDT